MRRGLFCILIGLFFLYDPARSQDDGGMKAVMEFLGSDPEDLRDSYEIERLQDLLARPLRINMTSRSKMVSSGLFTNYQAASLLDYIATSGDVLSSAELAAVNGFGDEIAERIAPFISFESSSIVGYSSVKGSDVFNDLSIRSAARSSEEPSWNYGLKYRVDAYGMINAALAVSKSYGSPGTLPDAFSGYLSWNFKRYDAWVIAGDFNARFGQGLALWNGMSLSGFTSVSSFIRRTSGLSRSWSFTGSSSLTGVASSLTFGRITLNTALALPEIKNISDADYSMTLLPMLNLIWYLPEGQLGMTGYAGFSGLNTGDPRIPDMKLSFDARFCIDGVDLFGEAAYDWVASVPAALVGTAYPIGDDVKMAAMLRFYPERFTSTMSAAPRSGSRCANEYAFTMALESVSGSYVPVNGEDGFGSSVRRHKLTFSADAAYFPESRSEAIPITGQIRMLMTWQFMLNSSLRVNLRLTERIRNWEDRVCRTDLRSDLTYLSEHVVMTMRMNALNCADWGFLTYLEGGYRTERLKLYLRQGVFFIDDWDDRIYAYERDAPGNFSVPAYYGRGVWSAFTASWRFSRIGRIYARAAVTAYPFMEPEKKKPGKAELKLQCVFDF